MSSYHARYQLLLSAGSEPDIFLCSTDLTLTLTLNPKPNPHPNPNPNPNLNPNQEPAPRLQADLPLPLLAERLFGLASAKRTRETNRKHLYALQQRVEAH